MDHLRRKTIRCEAVNTIVLDEADEMLNMGFREDIETILEYIPEEGRQTVLFSATMPKPILDITKKYQHDAVTIKVVKKELTVPSIEQYYYDVKRKDKDRSPVQDCWITTIQSFPWYSVIPRKWWTSWSRS